MPKAIDEALERDERERERRLSTVETIQANSLELLQSVYRSPAIPLPVRIRVAIAVLPFENPKLAVTATVDGGEAFGARLERAIARSGVRPKLIEAKAVESIDRRI